MVEGRFDATTEDWKYEAIARYPGLVLQSDLLWNHIIFDPVGLVFEL